MDFNRSGPAMMNDRRITTCKLCRWGIFKGNSHVWVTRPVPGLVHVECLNERRIDPIPR